MAGETKQAAVNPGCRNRGPDDPPWGRML